MTESTCACTDCICVVNDETAVFRNGAHYCCEACALGHPDGAPCAKSDCGCSSDTRG